MRSRLNARPDATADAVAGFQEQDGTARAHEFGGSHESGGPSADYDDIKGRRGHRVRQIRSVWLERLVRAVAGREIGPRRLTAPRRPQLQGT
jgi:hypothetical protein